MDVLQDRPDLSLIASLVPEKSRVLDIGCAEGTLLRYLVEHKKVDGRGIELEQAKVSECVAGGLSVVQGDADHDLEHYPDHAFDIAILSTALQMMHHPKDVLQEMTRIARRTIVSIPNFGHWKNRVYLGLKGRMPVTSALSYQWYETPNIHFCTLKDFRALAREMELKIESRHYFDQENKPVSKLHPFANLMAQGGVFVLAKTLRN